MMPDRQKRLITDIESELINCLLEFPKIDDPWNTADYAESDDNLSLENLSDAEIPARSQSFFLNLYD
jgi:hypothetical protein